MNKTIKVAVKHQGAAFVGEEGYMAIRADNVVVFYLDGWGKTGRAYCETSCRSVMINGIQKLYPSMLISDGDDDSAWSEIYFPEFEGWDVHSVNGGKTMSICLVKPEPFVV
jgi:hypothetical protein